MKKTTAQKITQWIAYIILAILFPPLMGTHIIYHGILNAPPSVLIAAGIAQLFYAALIATL